MSNPIIQSTKYHLLRTVAEGGMATVFEALLEGAAGFQKVVALKRIKRNIADQEHFVKMFIEEAKLVSSLVHENIVQIYQFGQDEEGYFIVMEYVHGLFLNEFLKIHRQRKQWVPVELAVFIASRMARGLAYAHEKKDRSGKALNIVHRDISPRNIAITAEGLPKLADFGLAVPFPQEKKGRTKYLVGKLAYMPPEQAQMEPVNFKADQYMLGVVLFELLALESFRKAGTQEELLKLAQAGDIDWNKLPKHVPKELLSILARCLNYSPHQRYESSQDLARELELFIYRDGYGPTIKTLEEYMRKFAPQLYV